MKRRRASAPSDAATLRLLTFRVEEWPAGTTRDQWWEARRAWEAKGRELPTFGPEDVTRAVAWHWRVGRWETPDQWRAELHAWEDHHGRLLMPPHAPFEPSGRGVYRLGEGRWDEL